MADQMKDERVAHYTRELAAKRAERQRLLDDIKVDLVLVQDIHNYAERLNTWAMRFPGSDHVDVANIIGKVSEVRAVADYIRRNVMGAERAVKRLDFDIEHAASTLERVRQDVET